MKQRIFWKRYSQKRRIENMASFIRKVIHTFMKRCDWKRQFPFLAAKLWFFCSCPRAAVARKRNLRNGTEKIRSFWKRRFSRLIKKFSSSPFSVQSSESSSQQYRTAKLKSSSLFDWKTVFWDFFSRASVTSCFTMSGKPATDKFRCWSYHFCFQSTNKFSQPSLESSTRKGRFAFPI